MIDRFQVEAGCLLTDAWFPPNSSWKHKTMHVAPLATKMFWSHCHDQHVDFILQWMTFAIFKVDNQQGPNV